MGYSRRALFFDSSQTYPNPQGQAAFGQISDKKRPKARILSDQRYNKNLDSLIYNPKVVIFYEPI
jgi:hypothetical protein